MFEMTAKILKWVSIPALTLVALCSCLAGRYETVLNLTICLSAVVMVQRAAWLKEYAWAAVCVVVFVVFSPLLLVTKIFLLMFLTSVGAFLTLRAAFRPQLLAAL
jgi:hypothetical protein